MQYDDCSYYYNESCQKGIGNWVDYSPPLTWFVNIFILLILGGLVWLGLWYLLSYRKRPFCQDCRQHGQSKRTEYSYDGTPVCPHHWSERNMRTEPTYNCSKHGVRYKKEMYDGVTIDKCPHGCIFLDDGELDSIASRARSSGQNSGQVVGLALGMAVG